MFGEERMYLHHIIKHHTWVMRTTLAIDAQLRPYASSERECVIEHMWHTEADDLLLYDRGYSGFWLFALHREYARKFCMHLPGNIYNQSRWMYMRAKRICNQLAGRGQSRFVS